MEIYSILLELVNKKDFWDYFNIGATVILNIFTLWFIIKTYNIGKATRQDNHLPILLIERFIKYGKDSDTEFHIMIDYQITGFIHYHNIQNVSINNYIYTSDKFVQPNNTTIEIKHLNPNHIFLDDVNKLKISYNDIHKRKFTSSCIVRRKINTQREFYWTIEDFKIDL